MMPSTRLSQCFPTSRMVGLITRIALPQHTLKDMIRPWHTPRWERIIRICINSLEWVSWYLVQHHNRKYSGQLFIWRSRPVGNQPRSSNYSSSLDEHAKSCGASAFYGIYNVAAARTSQQHGYCLSTFTLYKNNDSRVPSPSIFPTFLPSSLPISRKWWIPNRINICQIVCLGRMLQILGRKIPASKFGWSGKESRREKFATHGPHQEDNTPKRDSCAVGGHRRKDAVPILW